MYVLAAAYLPSAALRGSGLVARALLRADLFEKTVLIGTRTYTHPDSISSRLRLCIPHVTTRLGSGALHLRASSLFSYFHRPPDVARGFRRGS